MQEIADLLKQIIKDLFDVDEQIELTRTDPQFGDFACNIAMRLGKKLNQNSREIAQKIVDNLKSNTITKAEVAGPGFINLSVSSVFLANQLEKTVKDAPNQMFGANEISKGETVVCEFPSPNMAKPFSVGHIRAALQGWSIAQLMQLSGYKVITDNHLGDGGTPFGKWVVGFLKYSSVEKLESDGINELARVYIAITKDIKQEKEADEHKITDEVQEWLQKLESGEVQAIEYSKQFNQISLDHMHQVMQRLGISTEFEYGESYFVKRGQELAGELLKKGIAETSDRAVIVPLDEYDIKTPVMLRKANGTALYATTDLSTIEFRQQKWNPVRVFIHTGEEQVFYFKQLNALAKKAGYDDTITHLWHGLIDQINESGDREKMSSRKGVILLNDLLDEAEKRAAELNKEGSAEDIHAVALGAIKFADFTADRKRGVLFDWETMFNVQGFTGPAVQYAAVRINSILGKAEQQPPESIIGGYSWQAEHNLLLELIAFPDLVTELTKNYEMHKLAAYLYQLARTLNRYYENTQILKVSEPERNNRLWVLNVTKKVFSTGLDVLGIPVPSKM